MRKPASGKETGAVRVMSLVHYNTLEEIHRFRDVLPLIARNE
jgi:selenocysteine lyase/cysteine desulfurase